MTWVVSALDGPLWWLDDMNWGCDCAAKNDDCLRHSDICGITPIYASVVEHADPPPAELWLDFTMASTQTVIRCAVCGRERLGRDLDVIYEAPLPPYKTSAYKYPYNIVKAVCPEHNRRGTMMTVNGTHYDNRVIALRNGN